MNQLRVLYILTAVATLSAPSAHATSFTIVALPDTQNYVTSSNNAALFTQQTQWIADQILLNGNPRNIQFVTHLGDMVSSGSSTTQYNRADSSMSILDGLVPYGVLPGNHDYAATGNKSTGTNLYESYFGPARFAGQSWFGGADPSGINSYQKFSAGGYDFIHISLEWRPNINTPSRTPSPIAWAQSILDANPDTPVIMSTHEHIDDDPAGRSGSGQAVWDLLIRNNDQIFMVLNGHYHSVGGQNDGEYHQISFNDAGRPVFEVLQDFQDYPNGGDGWLRLIQFDIDNNKILFETYSPVLDLFQTETIQDVGGFASLFEFSVDFADRLAPVAIISPFTSITFQQGVDGYAGTQDKELRASGNDLNNGNAVEISVDGDDGPGTAPTQGLIQFANIIGSGANQVPANAIVISATLSLNVTNPGSGLVLYQMVQSWNENTSYASLGGNGVSPGIEAQATQLTQVGANNGLSNVGSGTLTLNMTDAMQNWLAGDNNHGVALLPFSNGTNGIDFDSSEGAVPPILTVNLLSPGIGLACFQNGIDGYSDTVDTQIRQAAASSSFENATSLSIDGDEGGGVNQGLIRFDNIFGLAPDQIPTSPATQIIRAELIVEGFNPGSGANLYRMLQPWADTLTWSGSFGADGIQADDTEAASTLDTATPGNIGPVTIDVTRSIQTWQPNPTQNHGWVLFPLGNDGWDIDTSEGLDPPKLQVYFQFAGDCDDDIDIDFDDVSNALSCLLGPDVGFLVASCECSDLNDDESVDLLDAATLQTYTND